MKATNLGPGVADASVDTFRLLKADPILVESANKKTTVHKEGLALKVDALVKQRVEFHN